MYPRIQTFHFYLTFSTNMLQYVSTPAPLSPRLGGRDRLERRSTELGSASAKKWTMALLYPLFVVGLRVLPLVVGLWVLAFVDLLGDGEVEDDGESLKLLGPPLDAVVRRVALLIDDDDIGLCFGKVEILQ